MNPIELGKFIANLRNEKNLTQEELAEKLYIDKRKISRWECGNSIPEFDMLIKLSEILDVSLYELSICKRIENDCLTRKVINKFKGIKDFKKYKLIKKIKAIALIIFFIMFIITSTYTIKNNGTVEIYELESIDDKYYLEGSIINANTYSLFYIKRFDNKKEKIINGCEYEIYNNGKRIFQLMNDVEEEAQYYEIDKIKELDNILSINAICLKDSKIIDNYSFDIKLTKLYDNKLF